MNIESLIKSLKNLTYESESGRYDWPVIGSSHFDLVEREVRLWASRQDEETERKQLLTKVGHLEAKCTAYEAIIKNSNFAPAIEAVKEPEE